MIYFLAGAINIKNRLWTTETVKNMQYSSDLLFCFLS